MNWSVNYYTDSTGLQPVKEWIDSLEMFDLELKAPYVKPLKDKLYELRVKGSAGIYRVIYFAHTGRQFIMLNGFVKKTPKTPPKEIALVKKRMKEVLSHE